MLFFRLRNPPSFSMELTLSAPCFCSDLPLSRQGAALAHLGESSSLPIAYFGQLRSFFPVRLVQIVQAFLLKPLPFCKLSARLDSTIKTTASLAFYSQTLFLFLVRFLLLRPFFFSLSRTFVRNYPLFSFRTQWLPDHSFFSGNDTVDELARRGACSNHLMFHIVSLFLFLELKRTVSLKFFHTWVYSVPTEELVLPRHACCVLSCLRCSGPRLVKHFSLWD